MAESILDYYLGLHGMSMNLLDMVRQERWDEFIHLAEKYVITMQDAPGLPESGLADIEKKHLYDILKILLDNEAEITKKLKIRLQTLQNNMSSLHHGKRCSALYSLQQTASFH